MPYVIFWNEAVVDTATRFLADDPEGLHQLLQSVDLLAARPRPHGTVAYGSSALRRMHVGRYRILYEVTDTAATIVLRHIGRIA
ncbi:type II toxin-antitoxin system RelE/ParE family toxin [Streptomyces sp. NPDC059851]|uniref:type II toxin-antitoxin system RelE family toxin n=1 Tax=Streptomyces sp. NPDC059851 TaxID=3346971 RepID=UPI0036512790